MHKSFMLLAVVGGLALPSSAPAQAAPGGCLKYGLAGAAAGHVVHHGVRGFAAGCAAGMYRRHLYNKQIRNQGAVVPGNPT